MLKRITLGLLLAIFCTSPLWVPFIWLWPWAWHVPKEVAGIGLTLGVLFGGVGCVGQALISGVGILLEIVKGIHLIEADFPQAGGYPIWIMLIIVVVSILLNTFIRNFEIRLEFKGILLWVSHYGNLRGLFSDDDEDDF